MNTERQVWVIPDFIREFSISRTSIYEEAKCGRLRLTKRGRRTIILRADAESWLSSLRGKSQAGK